MKSIRAVAENGCMCFQVWRQRACIASVGTRQTRTTFRNSLIKVKHSSAQTHACSGNRPMNTYLTIKKLEERACIAGFSKHGGKQSLLVSQNVFRNYFPINLNRAVIRTWEFFGKHFQNQASCVMCAIYLTHRENSKRPIPNLTTQQKCLKRNPCPVEYSRNCSWGLGSCQTGC